MLPAPFLKPVAMHIPDGFLSAPIALIFWTVSILFIVIAVRNARSNFNDRQIPLMGIMAAFIFAAQMINFPVVGGTSGHMIGGVLAAVTLGPWGGILVMTSVVSVQGLLFQDGGLLVMGANIFNMGVLPVLIGYGFYRAVISSSKMVRLFTIAAAAWLSVIAGALFTGLQLWLSGTSPLQIVIPAMLGIHALIGIGEALITVAAVAFILRTRPDLIDAQANAPRGGKSWILAGVLTALAVILVSPLASVDPDGLESVAEQLGFNSLGMSAPYQLISDYNIPGLGDTHLSTILAGLVGAVIVGLIAFVIIRMIRKPEKSI
jgi:cobalt/nickel transport system permease protein